MKLRSLSKKSTVLFGIFIICTFFTINVLAQQNQNDQAATESTQADEIAEGWRISDYKPYISALEDLQKLSKEYSDFLLKRAIDEYSKGLDTLDDMQTEIERLRNEYQNKKYLNEQWYWQEIDRKNAQERYLQRIKTEAKTKSVTHFTRSINLMDQIKSHELKSNTDFIDFKSKVFRTYVSTQYDLGNMKPCLPILERYVTLNDENRKDIWAHKYLASCYAFMEKVLGKYSKSSEDEIYFYRNKKNTSMLTAIELKYGTESAEYKELQRIVQLDEKKSEVININK
ncbi:MAG: hypothetical protein WDA74_06290 [Spirochaetota bacterium]